MRISHVGWNIGGLSLPLLIAVFAIPNLLVNLGQERFGLLTLAWGMIGYAGALDLGIGRAATLYIARLKVGVDDDRKKIPIVLSTAIRITLLVGFFAGFLIAILSFTNLIQYVKIENISRNELRNSMLLLAFALPMQAISATYKGVNEAYLQFKGVSFLRVFLGATNFGLPLVVSWYTNRLEFLIFSLVLSRFFALYFYKKLAKSCISDLVSVNNNTFSKEIAEKLLKFGGWFTLSGLLNPMVATADRFMISTIISAAAVSIYVIPYEMTAQSLILIGAVTTVTFPYFSQLIVKNPEKVKKFFLKILFLSVVVMAVVTGTFFIYGDKILLIWLKGDVNKSSIEILKILCFGLVPYTIGTLCVSLLHSFGKTEITAKLNLLEFPIFMILIYFCLKNFGVVGAAYAWVIRVTLDALFNALAIIIFMKNKYD